ncbi:MAG: dethiobiotin synthase [Deltaproteobacteria bacterium GWA2_45_12]|nr:MAG: dethiobiotin synthase [Deltaproteobacteria bacterium GWA2_45_12]
MKQNTFFICGTDTGVGKTLVTGALCLYFCHKKKPIGAFKPLESGCASRLTPNHIHRNDSSFLQKCAGMKEPLDEINLYWFKEALTPALAAKRAGIQISFPKIKQGLKNLQKKYKTVFVEGAGGLLAPIKGLQTNLDLIKSLKLPVIVVARLGLGTLNHTLLTLDVLKRNKIKVAGVILNQTKSSLSLADKTNPGILKQYNVPLLGVFPYIQKKNPKSLLKGTKKLKLEIFR